MAGYLIVQRLGSRYLLPLIQPLINDFLLLPIYLCVHGVVLPYLFLILLGYVPHLVRFFLVFLTYFLKSELALTLLIRAQFMYFLLLLVKFALSLICHLNLPFLGIQLVVPL